MFLLLSLPLVFVIANLFAQLLLVKNAALFFLLKKKCNFESHSGMILINIFKSCLKYIILKK